jgi:DNA-binding MarR family transcriptional regulator
MNYIELINHFWKERRRTRLTSTEADLYYFLMQESNIRGWENPLECSNGLIAATIGVTEKTLIDARSRLQQKGLISFVPGQRKKKSPVYTLLPESKRKAKTREKVSPAKMDKQDKKRVLNNSTKNVKDDTRW